MPFFKIINGLISTPEGVIKPGMIVEWTQEQADAWYPNQKGWIKPTEDPADHTVKRPAPTPEPKKDREYMPDPAETSAYSEPEPIEPPAEPEKLYQKAQKKPRR